MLALGQETVAPPPYGAASEAASLGGEMQDVVGCALHSHYDHSYLVILDRITQTNRNTVSHGHLGIQEKRK